MQNTILIFSKALKKMFKKTVIFYVMIVCNFALSLSFAQAETQEPKICRFGVPPWQKGRSFDDVRNAYQPMLNWLTEQTGCQFVAVGGVTYDDLVEKLVTGKVHLAELGPVTYVLATQKNPQINLLLTNLIWNPDKTELVDGYFGYIITLKKHNEINLLSDLKNKPFGFVDLESSSGYVYPNALLKDNGIDYKTFFSKTYFLKNHLNVTDAIASESIIAGATWQYNLAESIKKHGDIFKVIHATIPIPNNCLAAHPSLPQKLQIKIKQLLPSINQTALEKIGTKGFVERPDSFYNSVRHVMKQQAEP